MPHEVYYPVKRVMAKNELFHELYSASPYKNVHSMVVGMKISRVSLEKAFSGKIMKKETMFKLLEGLKVPENDWHLYFEELN
jgi:hypothetical protein